MGETTRLDKRAHHAGFLRGTQDYRASGASDEYPNTRDATRYKLFDQGEAFRLKAAALGSHKLDSFGLGYLSGVESEYWGTRIIFGR